MRVPRIVLALAASSLLLPAALAALPGPAPADQHVHIADFLYDPATVTVLVGESVTWDNHDGFAHTVSANDTSFDSGRLEPGQTFTHAFGSAGTFGYLCTIHSTSMFGTVIAVVPGSQPDLALTALSVADGPLSSELNATVRNLGLNVAAASTLHFAYRYQGASVAIADVAVRALGPGEQVVVKVAWDTLGKVGDFAVEATADAADEVEEGNEANNVATGQATVLVGGVEGIDVLDPL